MTPVIRASDLHKTYGKVHAVDGVSFEVGQGEVFGLLGPNGAGKTTTVEMLEGLTRPDSGAIEALGLDVLRQASALKERIGVQLQTAALYPNLTVAEVVDLFAGFYPRSRPTDEIIEALDLSEKRDAQTRHLSGGQRQRLSVALALVSDPELLFLDEPTTGLDPAARRALWDLIAGLRERGKTIVLTTHYLEEAETLCNRVAIMDHGRILELGTVDELVGRRFKERTVRFDAVEVVILGSPLEVAFLVVLGALMFISLGYVVASFAPTEDSANMITSIVQFPLMFLSGIFFPLESLPDWLRTVAAALPLTYLGDALRQVMVGGTPFVPVTISVAILAIWLVFCFGISARFFRWQ
jgi:ABC-2 type transport system ATP-binding protein